MVIPIRHFEATKSRKAIQKNNIDCHESANVDFRNDKRISDFESKIDNLIYKLYALDLRESKIKNFSLLQKFTQFFQSHKYTSFLQFAHF